MNKHHTIPYHTMTAATWPTPVCSVSQDPPHTLDNNLKEALKPVKMKPGRPPTTWISICQQYLAMRGTYIHLRDIHDIEELQSMFHDRAGWKAKLDRESSDF